MRWASSRCSYGGSKQTFSFVLTDTVVLQRQKPVKWLFTSKQERGKILCKTKKFLTTSRILREFLVPKWAPNTLPRLENDQQILATYAYLDRSSGFGEMHMVVEHLDKAALEHLLEEREKPGLSVLQRFIPTQSGYNHTVRSVYTADYCTVQKCISPFLLSDTRASVAQRTATFEVNDPLLRHRDVTDKEIQKAIERINEEMTNHLESIVGKEMVRFVNYFKVTHRSIIQQFERGYVEKNSDEDVESIPTLLRAISGPIQVDRFKQLKQSATYL
uniref:Uncharacterized protein n=1 Tax=Phytophthora ramorum TaxID=164328 RepID=H3HDA7_PHYRM